MKQERLLEASGDHNNLCCLHSDSEELNSVISFINEATASVRRIIQKGVKECEYLSPISYILLKLRVLHADVRPIAFTETTLRSRERIEELQLQLADLSRRPSGFNFD